jgi:hypothetical protein
MQLTQAMVALNGSSIPTIGPPYVSYGNQTPEEREPLEAFVDARSPERAEEIVRSCLPEGDYTISEVDVFKPADPDAD